jgi:NADH-quinone oxidoreductase subunit H
VAEYIGMIIMACIATTCFLGGWSAPIPILFVPPLFWFIIKVYFIIFLYYWIRATVPRYRYDHLMSLGWKVLIPLALANIIITGIVKVIL